jgi:L-rhamnose-H+ transport protein
MVDNSAIYLGISLAVISGLMGGTCTLPMRYLSRWSWENAWAIYVVVACLVMPPAVLFLTVANPLQVLAAAPARAEITALTSGFIWGFGSVLFGLGVSAIGISMANTLVLATSASVGSILPLLILTPERFGQPQGKAIMLGTVTALAGMGFCATRESCGSGAKKPGLAPRVKWSASLVPFGWGC